MRMQSDVWRLLRRNISAWQLGGYAIANVVGLAVVLIGVMFFLDSRHSTDTDGDQYFSSDYITLSKRVEGVGMTPVSFTDSEIADLEAKPWVKKLGRFTSSQFAVSGSIDMGGRGMSTYMFFEAVPDDFFDVKPSRWGYKPGSDFVPVIISKDYLALYNFGFAIPQGLPQLSEEVIGAVPLTLRITGPTGLPETFTASIVGFSSRLNTIAVPERFMQWANERFAPGAPSQQPSRLIVEVDRLNAADMASYVEANDLEIGGDKADTGKVSGFLSVISAVVTANGLVISGLALFILLLSIFLLLQKSRQTLRNLMLLGYSPGAVGKYYNAVVWGVNLLVTGIAVGVTFACRPMWARPLAEVDLGGASPLPVILVAAAYLVVVTLINLAVIRTHLRRIFMS